MLIESGMWAHAIIEELLLAGVTNICLAPGSRNTPLILAASTFQSLKLHTHYDERGLGYFGLGLAKALKAPVAIIVTSGTACGNLLPAVMEAFESQIPIIVLTADRPFELQDCGSNQTTNQQQLFHHFVRYELNLPVEDPQVSLSMLKSKISHALKEALIFDQGPLHINCMFREPFDLSTKNYHSCLMQTLHFFPDLICSEDAAESISQVLNLYDNGVILLGNADYDNPLYLLEDLCELLNWPVFIDPLAQIFLKKSQINYYSLICKHVENPIFNPSCILHLGSGFVSKSWSLFIKKNKPQAYIHIGPKKKRIDPDHLATHTVVCSVDSFCKKISKKIQKKEQRFFNLWKDLEDKAFDVINQELKNSDVLLPAHFFNDLSNINLKKTPLFVGNSMPIRDVMNFFHPKERVQVFGNRGLSGIDGNIATACGISQALDTPLLVIIGDLTFLHDLNSLSLLKNATQPIKLIVLNNQGGGIFSFLPIKNHPLCHDFFTCSQDLDLSYAAKLFGISYYGFSSFDKAIAFLRTNLDKQGHTIIEIQFSIEDHVQFYNRLDKRLQDATLFSFEKALS